MLAPGKGDYPNWLSTGIPVPVDRKPEQVFKNLVPVDKKPDWIYKILLPADKNRN